MERRASLNDAKCMFRQNFIGPDEIYDIKDKLGIYYSATDIPELPFSMCFLESMRNDYLLILFVPYFKDNTSLTIIKMKEHFGTDPLIAEPCFYNQDWYLNEPFAAKNDLNTRWYLIRKNLIDESRGIDYTYTQKLRMKSILPSALICTYTFFSYYFHSGGKILWPFDYIWCNDKDHNNDQIYVGRYIDPNKINKNGFSIHRHLSINHNYGSVVLMTSQ
jgi:hypothetical protein